MAYSTFWEEKGICWELSGIVTSQELFEFTNAFYDNPKSDTIRYQIVDCLNIEKFVLDKEAMAEIAALDYAASLSIGSIKVALVGKNHHVNTLNKKYISYSDAFHSCWKIKIFDNMDDARQWISS